MYILSPTYIHICSLYTHFYYTIPNSMFSLRAYMYVHTYILHCLYTFPVYPTLLFIPSSYPTFSPRLPHFTMYPLLFYFSCTYPHFPVYPTSFNTSPVYPTPLCTFSCLPHSTMYLLLFTPLHYAPLLFTPLPLLFTPLHYVPSPV